MFRPLVSVIIPNFNHARYLKARIDSVLAQTYTNFEVIILDDASTDESCEIIRTYGGNVKVKSIIQNDKNTGSPFLQWQRGLQMAVGDWVWIAESDDYADRRFLELLLAAVDEKPSVGLAYCDSKIVVGNTETSETFASLKNNKFKTNRWSEDHINNGLNELEDYLLEGGTINNTSAVLFSRKFLDEARPFDLAFKYIGDLYTFVKVLAISDIVYIKESLNFYRDPFNSKHADRFINYFYEQFVILDWVWRNTNISSKKFFRIFHKNTRNSVYRDWNKTKVQVYRSLFTLNSALLLRCIVHNLIGPFLARKENSSVQ